MRNYSNSSIITLLKRWISTNFDGGMIVNRIKVVVCLLVCLLITTSCGVQSRQDKVLETLGTPIDEAFYTHGGFQDYTDFGVYSYSSLKLERNEYFVAITHEDMETLGEYLDNFEQWIETFRQNDPSDVLVVNYAFDRSIIDESDFFLSL